VAGRIRREDIDELRERADVVAVVSDYTQLKRAGQRMKGLCPFHSEKTPSFTVNPERGLYHCFGCGEGGDTIDFLMKVQGLDFVEAVEQLARRSGFTLHYEDLTAGQRRALGDRSRLVAINAEATAWFQARLYDDEGTIARDYLKSRGFGRDEAKHFQIGFATMGWDDLSRHLVSQGVDGRDLIRVGLSVDNDRGGLRDRFRGRLIFPVQDASGDVIGFGGRILPGLDYGDFEPPKYYNSPETPLYRKTKVLYGLPLARTDMAAQGEVLICEGYTDVMALHQAGFGNAVATCGTAVGTEHFRLLSKYVNRVVLAFDSDAAGVAAAEKAWQQAREVDAESSGKPFELRVLVLPDEADPADYVQNHGVDALRERVDAATPVVPFLIRSHLELGDVSDETARTAMLRELVGLLAVEPDLDLRREYARTEVAARMGVSLEFVLQTAARQGVDIDRHEGAAVPARPVAHERGRIASVTPERARQERAVLRIAFQQPDLLPDVWTDLTVDDFHHPRARELYELLASAGGAGADIHEVLEAARDDEQRKLIREVAMEVPPVEDSKEAATQLVAALLIGGLVAKVGEVDEALSQVNASADPDMFRDLNAKRFDLERRRRELQDLLRA
jgi:DNA primase